MKKLFITIVLAIASFAGAFAIPKEVNAAILDDFNKQYKEVSNLSWLITPGFIKAEFTSGCRRMEVFYNAENVVMATSKSINLDEIPISAKRSFAKKFAGYTVAEAIRFEGFDDEGCYISGENEKETVILKVSDNSRVSLFKRTKK